MSCRTAAYARGILARAVADALGFSSPSLFRTAMQFLGGAIRLGESTRSEPKVFPFVSMLSCRPHIFFPGLLHGQVRGRPGNISEGWADFQQSKELRFVRVSERSEKVRRLDDSAYAFGIFQSPSPFLARFCLFMFFGSVFFWLVGCWNPCLLTRQGISFFHPWFRLEPEAGYADFESRRFAWIQKPTNRTVLAGSS